MTATIPSPSPKLSALSSPRLPIAQLVPSKTNPRKEFDAADIAEFAANIKKHDVIQSLLVRVHPTKSGAFEIVCGERRWRAAKEAGLVDVPADVRDLTDDQVLEIQLIENLNRRDLTALEEAEGYRLLLTRKYTHERIAEKIGRSVQYVRDRCRLHLLVKGAVELLREKRIEVGHAIQLARLSPEDQIRTIREPKDGGYGADRHSGLWQMQRDLPGTSIDSRGRLSDELKAVSVRELQAWIQDHVRLDPAAPQNAELFPEIAATVAAAQTKVPGEKPPKFIEITLSSMLNDDTRDPNKRVFTPASYKRADGRAGSKTCANSVAGIVVAGDGQGETFKVCIDKKKCQVHYKAEIAAATKRDRQVAKSGKTGQDRWALEDKKRKEEEQRRAAKRAAFEKALPAIRVAVFEKALHAPLESLKTAIEGYLGRDWNVGPALKAMGATLPRGKSADDFIRRAGVAIAMSGLYARYPHEEDVARIAKGYKVDTQKIIAAQTAPVVEKCRVCGCTETEPCRSRKTPTGPMEACAWTEAPDKKTGLGLCSACAEKTGQKAAARAKAKK